MNRFIQGQCSSMLLSCKSFLDGVRLAALKDDGAVSKEEKRSIKAIEKATVSYERKIKKIMSK